jgi:hypothetical protein
MRARKNAVVALAVCWLLLIPATAFAKGGGGGGGSIGCNLPDSDAESLVLLGNYYPGYWWDHTDLTIAVEAHPAATDEQLDAITSAIETWSSTLEVCFDGLITLTNVTGSKRQAADIASTTYRRPAVSFSGTTRSVATMGVRTSSFALTCHPVSARSHMTRSTSTG